MNSIGEELRSKDEKIAILEAEIAELKKRDTPLPLKVKSTYAGAEFHCPKCNGFQYYIPHGVEATITLNKYCPECGQRLLTGVDDD